MSGRYLNLLTVERQLLLILYTLETLCAHVREMRMTCNRQEAGYYPTYQDPAD